MPKYADIAGIELAKSGSQSEFLGLEPVFPLSNGWVKSPIKSLGHNEHCSDWNSLSECRQSDYTF
jgi:hypothetical protein